MLTLRKAIYLDGDIVADLDIAELWETVLDEVSAAAILGQGPEYWGGDYLERLRHFEVTPEL